MTTLTVTQAKSQFLKIIRNSHKRLERVLITKQGKPTAVLMNVDEYEGWLETLDIMADKKTLRELRKAKLEVQQGKVKTFSEVVGRKQKQ
jgi:antitoxin YefM